MIIALLVILLITFIVGAYYMFTAYKEVKTLEEENEELISNYQNYIKAISEECEYSLERNSYEGFRESLLTIYNNIIELN